MNNTATMKDGQAPARRIGALIAIVVICIGCACLGGLWYIFAREGLDSLMKSISLMSGGRKTTGTVTSVEEFASAGANFPSTSYKLTVSFEVNVSTYSVTSNAYYNPIELQKTIGGWDTYKYVLRFHESHICRVQIHL